MVNDGKVFCTHCNNARENLAHCPFNHPESLTPRSLCLRQPPYAAHQAARSESLRAQAASVPANLPPHERTSAARPHRIPD